MQLTKPFETVYGTMYNVKDESGKPIDIDLGDC